MTFEDLIIEEFQTFDQSKFVVNFIPAKIFLCGGPSGGNEVIPQSVRQRILDYFLKHDKEIYRALIRAENFKDYFQAGMYSDLMQFETEIAGIATMIIICLESAGSLVELGLFCTDPVMAKRLLVIAPQEHVEDEDSFIYLGPLESLRKKDPTSVIVYPWADPNQMAYEHIDFIAKDVSRKLSNVKKSEAFKGTNWAHVAFLIHDIILISNPIMLHEIEMALMAIDVNIERPVVQRLLFLLEKIGLVSHTVYSSVMYFFDIADGERRIRFGTTKSGKVKDNPTLRLSFKKHFILGDDEQSKKRVNVLKQIQTIKEKEK